MPYCLYPPSVDLMYLLPPLPILTISSISLISRVDYSSMIHSRLASWVLIHWASLVISYSGILSLLWYPCGMYPWLYPSGICMTGNMTQLLMSYAYWSRLCVLPWYVEYGGASRSWVMYVQVRSSFDFCDEELR